MVFSFCSAGIEPASDLFTLAIVKAIPKRVSNMSKTECIVRVSSAFDFPAERIFDAWLDPEQAAKFLFKTDTGIMKKVAIDARVGGRFCIVETRDGVDAEHVGEYLEIDKPRRLRFSFGGHPFPATYVTITITTREQGCLLELVHEGVWQDYESRVIEGWTGILQFLEQRVLSQPTS